MSEKLESKTNKMGLGFATRLAGVSVPAYSAGAAMIDVVVLPLSMTIGTGMVLT